MPGSFTHVRLIATLCLLLLSCPSARAQAVQETRIRVQISGAVKHPGVLTVLVGTRVADLIARAGGPRSDADLKDLNLTRVLSDGDQCQVLTKVQAPPVQVASASKAARGVKVRVKHRATGPKASRLKGQSAKGTGAKVHLNSASLQDLQTLPGVGAGLAAAILRQRQHQVRFHSLEDLREVVGFGQKRLERVRPYVIVD